LDLCNLKTLKEILERHGLKPQKKRGQHFLCSQSVVQSIINHLQHFSSILEIGPGPGVLTAPLSTLKEKVVAVEIDPVTISILKETAPQAEVIWGDALKVDLEKILSRLPQPRAIVSNMPYNITGPLLTRIAEHRRYLEGAVLMMQKEVGDRLLAKPGERERGSLSVFMQNQFEIKKVVSVKASAFYPPPKVESVVLELLPRVALVPTEQEPFFYRLIQNGFAHPRKTLVNNLMGKYELTRKEIETLLREISLSGSIRPHELEMKNWMDLAAKLHESRERKY
jgi:16S rRNA (adenine1518-N6/adenine1519-N6)-dimethyltransferase